MHSRPNAICNRLITVFRSYFEVSPAVRQPDLNSSEAAIVAVISRLIGHQILSAQFFGNFSKRPFQRKHVTGEKSNSSSFLCQSDKLAILPILNLTSFNTWHRREKPGFR